MRLAFHSLKVWLGVLALVLVAAPARAELHGGIEIGAKGVKATVLDVTPHADGYELSVKLGDTYNTALSAGIAKTGAFEEKAIADTITAIKQFRDKMLNDLKVPAGHISIVGSSGLFSAIVDKPDAVEANQKVLSAAVQKAVGVKMDFIDAKREAELSIAGIMPKKFHRESVLIDIGGGNTKGGYPLEMGYATMSIPFGTVTFTEKVKKADGDFAAAAKELRESLLRPALKENLKNLKELASRKRVYLSGGIVWAACTLSHPEATSAFTPLTVKDVDALLAKIAAGKEFPAPDLAGIADEAQRKKAASEIEKIKAIFPPQQLLAGLHLLRALASEMSFEDGGKQIFFARHGYLGWILAYVAEKGMKD
jgi:exopolyphosphatase/pppGpp-phosphohydrolase